MMPALDPIFIWVAAGCGAVVFAASGLLKFRDLRAFASAVENYQLLPAWMTWPFAIATPALECLGAAGLLFGSQRPIAAATLAALLGMFSAAIAINLARGRTDIDCGCFGPMLRQTLSGWLLARNAILLMIVALAALPATPRSLEPIDLISVGFGSATLILLYVGANYAIANAPKLHALRLLDA